MGQVLISFLQTETDTDMKLGIEKCNNLKKYNVQQEPSFYGKVGLPFDAVYARQNVLACSWTRHLTLV